MIAVAFLAYAVMIDFYGWNVLPFLLIGSLAWIISVGLKFKVLEKLSRLWMLELIVVFFGLISLLGLWLLRSAQ